MKTLRLGTGAGFSGDRIEPAVDLAERGDLDYLVFECLAERTIALAQQARRLDPGAGYDPMLEPRMRAILPIQTRRRFKIISNMGAANPVAAALKTLEIARDLGIRGLRIAAVTGDDILAAVSGTDFTVLETGETLRAFEKPFLSANAYTGAAPIVAALEAGADVILTGRASDPAMFLAPLIHEFGWRMDDWEKLGRGTLVGHMMECGGQVTGGYFADPGYKDVPDLANLGFPIAEVDADGNFTVTKLPGTGGRVSEATCKEQLLYEVHDPAAYLQPDVVADFSNVLIAQEAPDRVRLHGATGHPKTGMLKVSLGFLDAYVGEGQISYAGPGAEARGQLALEILQQRLATAQPALRESRGELIGIDAILGAMQPDRRPAREVRLRFAARAETAEAAGRVGNEVESLYLNGPAAGGGVTKSVREIVAIVSTLIPESLIVPGLEVLES
ncbi:acyclic terpene utilization AtuA family protein [Roseibium aggregatum]|uniref:DUF1446 domain-containing protein n=1 Tax=Roseibium aggregatum TaxID=187304 RepID=A0A939J595_9HYPH|nr:acyclic terpene utilization AtuA family protein [Roseibium aggregatum]MBN9671504.1 DUF1446 domain-containing protein [Roseibium aggregatum]